MTLPDFTIMAYPDGNWENPLIRLYSYFQDFTAYEGQTTITLISWKVKHLKIILQKPAEMQPGDARVVMAMIPVRGKMTPSRLVICVQQSSTDTTTSNDACPICLRTAEDIKDEADCTVVDRIFMKSKGPCKHVACRKCYQKAIEYKLKNAETNSDLSEYCFLCNY